MVNKFQIMLLTGVLGHALLQAQPTIASADSLTLPIGVVGLSQYGSSGLIAVPSPEVLSSGLIGASISYGSTIGRGERSSGFPLSLVFGVATRVEAFASFTTFQVPDKDEESNTTFGLKINSLHRLAGRQLLSFDARLHRVEFGEVSSRHATAVSARFLFSTPLVSEVTGFLAVGYRTGTASSGYAEGELIGGGGFIVPINNYLLAAAEVQTSERLQVSRRMEGRVGVKGFVLEHLQWTIGLEGQSIGGGTFSPGIFIGLGFSSGPLRIDGGPGSAPPVLLPEPPPLEEDTSSSGTLLGPSDDHENNMVSVNYDRSRAESPSVMQTQVNPFQLNLRGRHLIDLCSRVTFRSKCLGVGTMPMVG